MSEINSLLRGNGKLCTTIKSVHELMFIFYTIEKMMLKKINFLNSHWEARTENKLIWILILVLSWNMKLSKIFVEFTVLEETFKRKREMIKNKIIYYQKISLKGEVLSPSPPTQTTDHLSIKHYKRSGVGIKIKWLKHWLLFDLSIQRFVWLFYAGWHNQERGCGQNIQQATYWCCVPQCIIRNVWKGTS